MMFECCEHPRLHHAAIFDKYSEKRFKEAASVVQQEIENGFTLPSYAPPRRSTRSQQFQLEFCNDSFPHSNNFLVPIEG